MLLYYVLRMYHAGRFKMKLRNHIYTYMYCIERSVNISITESQGLITCEVAISDDISTHADFQVDGYHGC